MDEKAIGKLLAFQPEMNLSTHMITDNHQPGNKEELILFLHHYRLFLRREILAS